MKPLQKLIALAVFLLALGGIFAMYGHPDFLMTIANQVWGCF